ncbi:MAG TPA: gamma-glutamyl-gamma-aminobutyrate hydrolase family protein [Candidatus Limnocylindria bacterium]|nr:gamma-glutamyl-gamma-aminobutyrate hydrolase family protein [Candidatus Limnocylindria bacterium]
MDRPRIVVTLTNPERTGDAAVARVKNARYMEAVERAGGAPVAVDDATPADELRSALSTMDGLLISGGPDLDPALYGEPPNGSHQPDAGRDAVDTAAFRAAEAAGAPVLGICRGLQAINVLSGGSLVQHVDGHESAPYPSAPGSTHAMSVLPGTLLWSVTGGQPELLVNTYHHQAITPERLAPALRAAASATSAVGALVEALESRDPGRWLVGVQCHPERVESSPPVLERLWTAFVAAAAAYAARRSAAAGQPG